MQYSDLDIRDGTAHGPGYTVGDLPEGIYLLFITTSGGDQVIVKILI